MSEGMGSKEREWAPRGTKYNIGIIQTFTDNPECKRGDLHNVTDDEYILIIIAGRFHHSLGHKRDRNGCRRGRSVESWFSWTVIPDSFPILSTFTPLCC